MHIALVNQWYPPDHGGVAVYNETMARAYVALGHRVTVITARPHADLPPLAEEGGVRVYRVKRWVEPYAAQRLPWNGYGHVRSLRHLAYSRKVCGLLHRLARGDGTHGAVDVVEFAEINAEGWVAALRGNTVPTVVRCHVPHALLRRLPGGLRFDSSVIERAEAAFVRRATAVTAPSAYLARWMERETGLRPGRIQVIPNGIDVAEFSPATYVDGLAERRDGGPLTILHVGRLELGKGCFVLAEALAHLAARERGAADGAPTSRPAMPWRAVFVGDDRLDAAGVSNRARLERFFAENGLMGRVQVRGAVAHPALVDLYRSAGLCVTPSLQYENAPYTCLEALACGVPLVASARGGIPEVVSDGESGLLVPPGDAVALAGALERLLGDALLRRRLGQAGRERAVRLYAHRGVATQNLALYARAMERRRGRCA